MASKNLLGETDRETTGCSVMISYDRKDKAFVKNIYDALAVDDRSIWVDWEDIAPSHDWTDEIHKGIQQSDCFIFVLSPDSIANKTCNGELEHAVTNCKRIIPIVCRDVDYTICPSALAERNWIFFRQDGDDFFAAMKLLLKALDVDLRHTRYHTKLLMRAIDCERHKSSSLLLKGDDLKRAKHWLGACALGKQPHASTLHLKYITTSGAGLFSKGDALFIVPAADSERDALVASEARLRAELATLRGQFESKAPAKSSASSPSSPTARAITSTTGKSAADVPTPVNEEAALLRAQIVEMKASQDRAINEACEKRARDLTTLLLNQFNARSKKENSDKDDRIAELEKQLADARNTGAAAAAVAATSSATASGAPPSYS